MQPQPSKQSTQGAASLKKLQPSQALKPRFTKSFISGGSQAVRIPKAFRISSDTLKIERNEAGQIVITEVDENAQAKRLLELQALFQSFTDNPLTHEDDFELPPRELADFRSPFEKTAGEPPLTFAETPQNTTL